ncbi:MAG: PEP-CTERM/exosortase system-associated acyltransferase [Alphaproteobacteria bacterium]
MQTEIIAKRRGRKPLVARYLAPQELADIYDQVFEAVPAVSGLLLNAALHLRYQVLCEERRLLRAADYPEKIESDAFDEHAMHAVLCYRPDRSIAGTLRVLMPDAGITLPVFARCPQLSNEITMSNTAELSRFVIAKQFRRRWDDNYYGAVTEHSGDGHNQRRIPHMSLGLLRVALEFVAGRGITHIAALTEPAMMKMLEKLGVHLAPVGEMVECHGLRQPCYAKLENLLRRMKQERPDVWHYVTDNGRFG